MEKKGVLIGVQVNAEVSEWLKRAAAKARLPVSKFASALLRAQFDKRNA